VSHPRVHLTAPPAVAWVARTLEDHGFETWAVGGAVRDALAGRPSGDWDFTTRARPKDIRRVFKRTVPVGIEHGTVGVLARDGTMYEVTTFRRDVETDGRHAVVSFADRIDDDLARRDFTVNAIAWHPLTERLHDPFDGRGDLERGLLRTVGEPQERFREDYLRVLRAFRFAGRFGLDIDAATWSAIVGVTDRLPGLSAERIRDELLKVLDTDPMPSRSLGLYAESGALAALYPEVEDVREAGKNASGPSDWTIALAVVDSLPVGNALLRLGALLKPLGEEAAAQLLFRLRLSNAQVDRTLRLVTAPPLPDPGAPDAAFRRWLSGVGRDVWPASARLELAYARTRRSLWGDVGADPDAVVGAWRTARRVRDEGPPLTVGDLELDGRDLISLGLRPGPRFGEILEELLDWVLDDPSRNRTDLLVERVLAMEAPRRA
jgi:tRNA nucleotidyltransferase (CCA-adding enzyme)